MDFQNINWALVGAGVSIALFLILFLTARMSRWTLASLFVALGFFCLAALTSAAPIRGYVDPNYVGWGLGWLRAEAPADVLMAAGLVFASAAISAFLAVRNASGPIMWFPAIMSGYFLTVIGVPILRSAAENPDEFALQFGEYLTIPGMGAIALVAALLLVPFAYGVIWGLRRALTVDQD